MKVKKTRLETLKVKSNGEAILQEPSQDNASVDSPLTLESSIFIQAPPVMDEDTTVEKVEENTSIDDLLSEQLSTDPKIPDS